MARILMILTAAVLCSAALAPDRVRADDRKIAQQIADVMKTTGVMENYDILVTYSDGTAKLQGTVSSNQQMRTAIEITNASPHVNSVVNKLSIAKGAQAPVEIRPAAPLDRPMRISPVAAEKQKTTAVAEKTASTPSPPSARTARNRPQVVAASLRDDSPREPVVEGAPTGAVTPPIAARRPVLTAAVPPNQRPPTQRGMPSSRRVVPPAPSAFSRPVPMGPSSLALPAAGGPSRPRMDPRMAQRDPRMAQMDPRMAQMDPRMAQMDPRMAQRDPRMAQRDPRMAQRDPRMAQRDPRMAQRMPPPQSMGGPAPVPSASQSPYARTAMAALAAPLAVVAAPFAALAPGGQRQGPGPQPAHVPGTGGGVAPVGYDQPQLPAYAWPSYAPYPNYAALTYPKQYSPTAWPYIGPFYPYPQVPLGWRKVTLEWDDGWWFLDFKDK
jgi:hypothetical protein